MKTFDRFIVVVSFLMMAMILVINFIMFSKKSDDMKLYKVEINRIEQEITNGNKVSADNYHTILGIYEYDTGEDFYNAKNEYVIREINGILYRIEYADTADNRNIKVPIAINISLLILFLLVLSTLLYIRNHMINPFIELSDYPYRLAKGTLSIPLKENK
ncbi:MAG: sensor histidine kinase, partial [Oscillospiraceae bacterium]|nr:sensor histidine kinase [Oscillospiraceae bacterium]